MALILASSSSVYLNKAMAADYRQLPEYQKMRVQAEQGDVDAQLALGIYQYNQGMHGSQQDAKEAIEWLNKAASKGSAGAKFYLGAAYNTGTGVTKNPDEALSWFRKAAADGNLDAQATVGNVYFNRDNGYFSYLWTCYAAQHGHHNAIQDLALIESYLTPNQISQAKKIVQSWNPQKVEPPAPAFEFATQKYILNPPMDKLRKAAEEGNPLAQLDLGRQYMSSIGKVPRNNAEGMKWIHKAADAGNVDALRTLSSLTSNSKEKSELANKIEAQEKFDAESLLNGLSFRDTGSETPKDPAAAIHFWTKLAEKDHDKRAFYNLGLAYHKGLGVEKNDVTASMWFSIAVAHFDWKESLEANSNLKLLLTSKQLDERKRLAEEWIQEHPLPTANGPG